MEFGAYIKPLVNAFLSNWPLIKIHRPLGSISTLVHSNNYLLKIKIVTAHDFGEPGTKNCCRNFEIFTAGGLVDLK